MIYIIKFIMLLPIFLIINFAYKIYYKKALKKQVETLSDFPAKDVKKIPSIKQFVIVSTTLFIILLLLPIHYFNLNDYFEQKVTFFLLVIVYIIFIFKFSNKTNYFTLFFPLLILLMFVYFGARQDYFNNIIPEDGYHCGGFWTVVFTSEYKNLDIFKEFYIRMKVIFYAFLALETGLLIGEIAIKKD